MPKSSVSIDYAASIKKLEEITMCPINEVRGCCRFAGKKNKMIDMLKPAGEVLKNSSYTLHVEELYHH